MTKMPHTHYDNLKVQAGASEQEIRQSYRRLVSKHHPDRNGNSPESIRIMQIINQSYEVLIDPQQRARHDNWITAQKAKLASFHRPRKTGADFETAFKMNDVKGAFHAKMRPHYSSGFSSFDGWHDTSDDSTVKPTPDDEKIKAQKDFAQAAYDKAFKEYTHNKIDKDVNKALADYYEQHNSLSALRLYARLCTWTLVPSLKPLTKAQMQDFYDEHEYLPKVADEPLRFVENTIMTCVVGLATATALHLLYSGSIEIACKFPELKILAMCS